PVHPSRCDRYRQLGDENVTRRVNVAGELRPNRSFTTSHRAFTCRYQQPATLRSAHRDEKRTEGETTPSICKSLKTKRNFFSEGGVFYFQQKFGAVAQAFSLRFGWDDGYRRQECVRHSPPPPPARRPALRK